MKMWSMLQNSRTKISHAAYRQEHYIIYYGVFNDAVSSSDYIVLNGRMIIMTYKDVEGRH
jgi:hypothetical protein